jgi:very-short-patch-repair endonuclease
MVTSMKFEWDKAKPDIAAKVEGMLYDYAEVARSDEGIISESPIEYLMAKAFQAFIYPTKHYNVKLWPPIHLSLVRLAYSLSWAKMIDFTKDVSSFGGVRGRVLVFQQVELEDRRFDFVMARLVHDEASHSRHSVVIVECDGYEHHLQDKAQFRKDRAKDRVMLRRGIPTMRFCGAEIWENPHACAQEAFDCLINSDATIDGNFWVVSSQEENAGEDDASHSKT